MLTIIKTIRWTNIHKNIFAKFATNSNKEYIPLRPLKEERTVLYDSAFRTKLSWFARLLAYTPFIALSLEGLINEWSPLIIGGSVICLIYGIRKMGRVRFFVSHQINKLAVSKNLSRFQITTCYNQYTRVYEDIIESSSGQTHQNYLLNQFKRGVYEINKKDQTKDQKQLSDEEVVNQIEKFQKKQNQIVIQLGAHQIDKMEFVSYKQVKKLIGQRMWNFYKKDNVVNVLQKYSTEKQEKNCLLITTKMNINERLPMVFFLQLDSNEQKKYDQYLKAFGEGKKIVQI